MDKIIYKDQDQNNQIKAITGQIKEQTKEFLKIIKQRDQKIVWIPTNTIVKVEQEQQSKAEE